MRPREIDWQRRARDEEILEARSKWSKGYPVSYVKPGARELIEGDLFHDIDWADLSADQEDRIKSSPFTLNGVWRRIKTIGWQGSYNGLIGEHPEPNLQEEAHVASGELVMTITGANQKPKVEVARGIIPIDELEKVAFVLRVVEGDLPGQEHLALTALANFRVDMPRLVTEQGWSHATVIPRPSKYLIVKHEVAKITELPHNTHHM